MDESQPNWFRRDARALQGFWRQLSEGLTLQELWAQFRKETTAGYRSYAKGIPPRDPEEKEVKHTGRVGRFTTGVFAELVPATGLLLYVNAGHNPPLLCRASREVISLEAGGLPLGIQRDGAYECRTLSLAPGDALVLYTDGVVEAENEQREQFGESRLRDIVRAAGTSPASVVLERILQSVEKFIGMAPQGDDITCFVMRYRGRA